MHPYIAPVGTIINLDGSPVRRLGDAGVRTVECKESVQDGDCVCQPPRTTELELLHVLAMLDGTLFNEEQAKLFYVSRGRSTGNAELAIRDHLNLSDNLPGNKGYDIDESGVQLEVKEYGKSKIKPGGHARRCWNVTYGNMHGDDREGMLLTGTKNWLMTNVPEENPLQTWQEAMSDGVSVGLLDLMPFEVSERLRHEMRPSRTMSNYPNLALAIKPHNGLCGGYIVVPFADYDKAFNWIGSSQSIPRYTLNRQYIENRVCSALSKLPKVDVMNQKIGIVAGSFKPFHLGHFRLIEKAAKENNKVVLFVSLADRGDPGSIKIKGSTMADVWKQHLEGILPANVDVRYSGAGASPITALWHYLGQENEQGSTDSYKIYTKPRDTERFSIDKLEKYADRLFRSGLLHTEPVHPDSTANVSGTTMRKFILLGDKDGFINNLPAEVDSGAVWSMLNSNIEVVPPKAKPAKKKR